VLHKNKKYAIETMLDTETITNQVLSHDDLFVLYSSNKSGNFNAYIRSLSNGEEKQATFITDNAVQIISFFPSDYRFLFHSDLGGNEQNHIFLCDFSGRITDLTPSKHETAEFYCWSEDGTSFLYGSNLRNPKYMDVYEMDVSTFQSKLIYENNNAYQFGCASNNQQYLAFKKVYTVSNTNLFLYNRLTGTEKCISSHHGDIFFEPKTFSVDSEWLYYRTDENAEFTYIKRYSTKTGISELYHQEDWDIWYIYFSPSGRYQYLGINEDAKTRVKLLDTLTKRWINLPIFTSAQMTNVKISSSEKLLSFLLNGSNAPNHLYVLDLDNSKYTKLIDTLNPAISSDDLVQSEVVRYPSFDGLQIPAIFYKPKNMKEGEKVPAIVWVHGGPGDQSRIDYSAQFQFLAYHGYAILSVNNRGSSGYGKSFFKAADSRHGDLDLTDCIEAKKFLISTGCIDENKIGIMGHSYGGYIVLAALAFKPAEFQVGIDVSGVSNWVRTLKNSPPWFEVIREAFYKKVGNPYTDESYLRSISPLFHAENIIKPLLVLQGENDPRVLKVESDEIVKVARKNQIPVDYIVFKGEGHSLNKKKSQLKANKAILTFLKTHL
jgi:dipeptidyl aminopeptidase/acylaminoacyl peptidase